MEIFYEAVTSMVALMPLSVMASHIGFSLNGGRYNGFRGYTYKQNLSAGDLRVLVETENQKTIAVHSFNLKDSLQAAQKVLISY